MANIRSSLLLSSAHGSATCSLRSACCASCTCECTRSSCALIQREGPRRALPGACEGFRGGICLYLRRSAEGIEVSCGPQGWACWLSMEDPTPPPHPSSAAEAFETLLASLPKNKSTEAAKFVKRIDDIPEIALPPEGPIQVALSLADRSLVGQFTGLWPSSKTTKNWVARN